MLLVSYTAVLSITASQKQFKPLVVCDVQHAVLFGLGVVSAHCMGPLSI